MIGIALPLCVTANPGHDPSAPQREQPVAHADALNESTQARRLVHTEPSDFAPVVVYDVADQRCMTFTWLGNPDAESCFKPAAPEHMVFSYTRTMMAALYFKPEAKRVLVIGLGGGTLPRAVAAALPGATIDTVEIDPAVARVAHAYFEFRTNAQQRVYVEDGRAFIRQAAQRGERYDVVMLDAFDTTYIPTQLMTVEFLKEVRERLEPDGVLVANTASASPLYERESATYLDVFGDVYQSEGINRILFATHGNLPVPATLRRNVALAAPVFAQMGIDGAAIIETLVPYPACHKASGINDRPACQLAPLTDAEVQNWPD